MTLAYELKAEEERLRRRFVHATRPREPMSMDEAIALSKRMQGDSEPKPDEKKAATR